MKLYNKINEITTKVNQDIQKEWEDKHQYTLSEIEKQLVRYANHGEKAAWIKLGVQNEYNIKMIRKCFEDDGFDVIREEKNYRGDYKDWVNCADVPAYDYDIYVCWQK